MEISWWHWIVLGIVLVLTELAVPAFVLIWFGLGAVIVGLLMLVLPSIGITAQVFLWTVASIAMTLLWFKVFRMRGFRTRSGMSDAHVLGEVGVLARDVEPFGRGSVRFQKPLMGSESWDCISDETIKANERVKVVAMEGHLLKVAKA